MTEDTYMARYESEQQELWQAFYKELNRLITEFKVTESAMAKGLGLSRTPVREFLSNPSRGLPIHRGDILRLHDFLTDPKQFGSLSEATQQKRKALKEEGPNRLLEAIGFKPLSSTVISGIKPERHSQLQRIASRLSSPFIQDVDLDRIANTVFDEILGCLTNSGAKEDVKSQDEPYDVNKAKDWLEYTASFHAQEKEKFIKAINAFARSGKKLFYRRELFELISSIKENQLLNQQILTYPIIKITECQFKNLTFIDEDFEQELIKAKNNPETDLRKSDEYLSYSTDFPPIIEVHIKGRIGEQNVANTIAWRFSSCQTHVGGMLLAIKNGLGYPLKLTGFSIRALGKDRDMLARISVALTDEENGRIHYGLWVEQNIILGILQAAVSSVTSWLFNQSFNLLNYYDVCKALAEIDENLYCSRNALNNYTLQNFEEENESEQFNDEIQVTQENAKIHLEARDDSRNYLKNAIDKAEIWQKQLLLEENKLLYSCHGILLERKLYIAKWMRIRSAHIEGELRKAKKYLDEEDSKKAVQDKYAPISILYTVEDIIYKFFSGDEMFLSQKQWRNDSLNILDICLENLRNHIESLDPVYGKSGVPDFDVYLSASEIFGNIGRLDFYFSEQNNPNDIKALMDANDKFLKAAYFSAKIGLRQRVGHWTTHISRVYSQLGQQDKAKTFLDISRRIISQAIEPRSTRRDERDTIMAEVNLAAGELFLLKGENLSALKSFMKALKGSISIGFCRLIADSLYGSSLASYCLSNSEVKEVFLGILEKKTSVNQVNFDQGEFRKYQKLIGVQNSFITEKIANSLNELIEKIMFQNNDDIVPHKIFKIQAQFIWNQWAIISDDQAKHLIADRIENETFLDIFGLKLKNSRKYLINWK